MGLSYPTYRQWEVFSATPSTMTLANAVRALEVGDWERLVLWLGTGQGEPEWLTAEGALERGLKPEQVTESVGKLPQAFLPERRHSAAPSIPWRAIELLAQQGRVAQASGNENEVRAIEVELLDLIEPHVRARERRSDGDGAH
jgi:hypothetical protein